MCLFDTYLHSRISAKSADGKLLKPRTEEPYFFTFGKSEVCEAFANFCDLANLTSAYATFNLCMYDSVSFIFLSDLS